MSELKGWQKAIQQLSEYEPKDYSATYNMGQEILRLESRIKELERQLEEAKPSKFDKEDLEIGRKIRWAAEKLPELFNIEIHVEKGYAGVTLVNKKGRETDFDFDEHLSDAISEALDAAIKEAKE